MTDHGRKPIRWANDLNTILSTAVGEGRFPIPIERLAIEYSKVRFPDTPVVEIQGGSLGSFEGALYPVRNGKGWAIIYNSDVSEGRRRFTIAHEFGHYLMHRPVFPDGLQCDEESVTFRGGTELEQEADTFAAYLLMPFDDLRRQIPPDCVPSLEDLSALADRYGVSLISCIIRWLESTDQRSMIVISKDDFVLWAKASDAAFKSGLFIRTRDVPPVEVPRNSLARRPDFADIAREGVDHPAGVWFSEDCKEITLHSDKYDQVISILHFGRRSVQRFELGEERERDTYDQFDPGSRGRFGDNESDSTPRTGGSRF
jgi:Zn-dependent peptidase ImmA (M78 family)